MRGTQTDFWAVNMGAPPPYDPVSETEYLVKAGLKEAESDEVLRYVASTFDPARDRIIPGTGPKGPRILDFAPILVLEYLPLNTVIKTLLNAAEATTGAKVEIEFAVTIEQVRDEELNVRLGFLQVRPMVVPEEIVAIADDEMADPAAVAASNRVMGNGVENDIRDIVFVRPENFSPMRTPEIAQELGQINRSLREQGRPYLLIGFGRWGSSHPSLGIPVDWSQISGARTIVEATLPEMNVELSQGSHFFHNLSSFRASYFMVPYDGPFQINWEWLNQQPIIEETELVRHVRPRLPLSVKVDGRHARGVIKAAAGERMNGATP